MVQNEMKNEKKTHGFHISKNMANFSLGKHTTNATYI